MKRNFKEESLSHPQKSLIPSFTLQVGTLFTLLLLFYLQFGLVFTKMHRFFSILQRNVPEALYCEQWMQKDMVTRILTQVLS